MTQSKYSTRQLTLMAMFAAIAYVAMLVTRPLPQIAGFLSYDLKDVVIAVAGFLLGPAPALAIAAVVSLIEMVTVSGTGPIGLLMNVLSTSAFALPPAMYYARNKSLRAAGTGLALGVAAMTAVMLAWNYIVTPLYMGVPREVVASMLLPTFLPFNLFKGGLNAGITMLIYKPVVGTLRRIGMVEAPHAGHAPHRFNWTATLLSAFVIVTSVVVLWLMSRPS
ncbi:MAG: ECF transporter S component [Clostridiales bacterium]|nr:ECF transporter S component [Clostridiales bacterium]